MELVAAIVTIIGTLAGIFFGWRQWAHSRQTIDLRFRVQRDQKVPPGQLGPWGLLIIARCVRGSAWIRGLSLEGKRAGLAWPPESSAGVMTDGTRLQEGDEVFHFVPIDEFQRAHREDGAAIACWSGADDRRHCDKIPAHISDRLLSANPGMPPPRQRRWLRRR